MPAHLARDRHQVGVIVDTVHGDGDMLGRGAGRGPVGAQAGLEVDDPVRAAVIDKGVRAPAAGPAI